MATNKQLITGASFVCASFIAIACGAASASSQPAQGSEGTSNPSLTPIVAQIPVPAPVRAPDTNAPTTQVAGQGAPAQVCRTQTNLGSRLGKRRVCRTAVEWELMRRDAQEAINARQRMNSAGRSKGDGG